MRLFISHSWTYSDAYEKLVNILTSNGLEFYNHSVPKDDPVHTNGTGKELRQAIKNHMNGVNCVLILAGVYSSYSKWINEEITMATEMGKPIIAIEPWGSERTSKVVKDAADEVVGWNGPAIIRAIKRQTGL